MSWKLTQWFVAGHKLRHRSCYDFSCVRQSNELTYRTSRNNSSSISLPSGRTKALGIFPMCSVTIDYSSERTMYAVSAGRWHPSRRTLPLHLFSFDLPLCRVHLQDSDLCFRPENYSISFLLKVHDGADTAPGLCLRVAAYASVTACIAATVLHISKT